MGDTDSNKVRVPALPYDGQDQHWTAWKLRFTSWMKRIGVYDVMTGDGQEPTEEAARTTFVKKNQVAYTYIITNVSDTAFNMAAQAPEDNGQAAWALLLHRYETKSRAQKINLLSELMRAKLYEYQDPEELFTKINDITKQLSYWENLRTIDDDWLIGITVNALPEGYKELVTVLDNEDELTFEEAKNKIRSFRARRISPHLKGPDGEAALYVKKSKNVKCFKCNKLGHMASDCAVGRVSGPKWCTLHKSSSHSDSECRSQLSKSEQANYGF